MKVSEVCRNYFNGFHEISNYKNNTFKVNAIAVLKIVSYGTLLIPAGVGFLYIAVSLYERVTTNRTVSDDKVTATFFTHKGNPIKVTLQEVLSVYYPKYRPNRNQTNLEDYSKSEDYKRHAKTACVYYNSSQIEEADALRIVFQREPTNIAMGNDQYDVKNLKKLFGYEKSVYNDVTAKKTDGTSFGELPNTAAVYSETYMWSPVGGEDKKEIACLSLPAPALDSDDQPHYNYYMKGSKLDVKKYKKEMTFLFRVIEKAVRDHKDKAFGNKGLKRVVLSKFGQGAFLEALSLNDANMARNIYKKEMAVFLGKIKDIGLDVVMSEYSDYNNDPWHNKMINGDIIETCKEGDLIVNAWDPHSAPGNGNDADRSFDGAMGKGSGILLTQTSWLNKTLRIKKALVAVL